MGFVNIGTAIPNLTRQKNVGRRPWQLRRPKQQQTVPRVSGPVLGARLKLSRRNAKLPARGMSVAVSYHRQQQASCYRSTGV